MRPPDCCPNCAASLIGAPIPESINTPYEWGGETHYPYGEKNVHWHHAIGIEISGVYDGTLFYICPFCNKPFHRFLEAEIGTSRYNAAIEYMKDYETN